MATEELIVLLDAKTQKLDAKLKATDEKLKGLEDQTKRNDSALANMAKAGIKLAGAATVAATALSTMVLMSARSVKELKLLSDQAGLTLNEFNALASAAKVYNVDAEKMADISKDLKDKIGEFSAVGTGAFQDFVDVVGLSKDEALETASQFQHMSSDQVLGQMVSQMEAAGATGAQMTFVMESMGSDASRLIPLFQNQSQRLNELTNAYDKINGSLELTQQQQDSLIGLSTDWDNFTKTMGNSANVISATLAPTLSNFINDVIKVVPEATQVLVDFFNTFIDAKNQTDIKSINRQIQDLNDELDELPEKAKKAQQLTGGYSLGIADALGKDAFEGERKAINERLAELTARKEELEAASLALGDAAKGQGGEISGSAIGENVFTDADGNEASRADAKSSLDLMMENIQLQTEQLTSANASELELLKQHEKNKLDILDEGLLNGLIKQEDYDKARLNLTKITGNAQEKLGKQTFESMLSAGASQSRALFEANKIYSASQVALKIPEAVQNSYAWGSSVGGPVGGAAAAAIALTASLAQLKSIQSQSFGGASSASSPSPASPNISSQPQTIDVDPSVDVNVGDVSTGVTSSMTLILEDGTEIATGLLEGQNNAESNGRGDLF